MAIGDRLAHRVALVAGGGGEIGAAICRRFAAEGAEVAIADLDPNKSEAAARAITVMLYGFAAFAKLNHDFVDVSVSCAAQFYGHITRWWPPLPDGPELRRAVVLGTIAAESLLALGLCVRRLRPVAVFGGLLFHIGLALDATKAFLNFSSVMFALLLLFLPRELWVLSGSMLGWGDEVVARCDAVAFLTLDPAERIRRLEARERARHGGRPVDEAAWAEFLEWARGYDDPAFDGRSRVAHEKWLASLELPVLRLDSACPPTVLRDRVLAWDGG